MRRRVHLSEDTQCARSSCPHRDSSRTSNSALRESRCDLLQGHAVLDQRCEQRNSALGELEARVGLADLQFHVVLLGCLVEERAV